MQLKGHRKQLHLWQRTLAVSVLHGPTSPLTLCYLVVQHRMMFRRPRLLRLRFCGLHHEPPAFGPHVQPRRFTCIMQEKAAEMI